MKRTWKPGDVASVRNEHGIWNRAIRVVGIPEDFWQYGVSQSTAPANAEAHPLVVIDPEDREQAERLTNLLLSRPGGWMLSPSAEEMTAALRSLITSPEPEEPTGLGALVEAEYRDADGKGFGPAHWARTGDGSWTCLTDGLTRTQVLWPFLTAVRVLSEGIS